MTSNNPAPVVVRSDARCLPLTDASVDLIVTSPPYFALRSYQDGGEHYDGQVGAEATPAEFVDTLIACTREWMRVLKPSGSLWVNLGDKYAGSNGQQGGGGKSTLAGAANARARGAQQEPLRGRGFVAGGAPAKSLIGIPWRYALRCVDELGLILRAEVIWSKPNGLPESVNDRVRRSHEQWFHFTMMHRYFSAVDEIREQYDAPFERFRTKGKAMNGGKSSGSTTDNTAHGLNPLGKLPGSVWIVATEPLCVPDHLGVDHFAAFPTEFPRRIIQGWSPAGVCVECGEGRRPVAGHTAEWSSFRKKHGMGDFADHTKDAERGRKDTYEHGLSGAAIANFGPKVEIRGYACDCPEPTAPTTPAVVLDPFGGTGTTALVAHALGRVGISVDLSYDYSRLARWRTADRGQLAKAMRVEKPPVQTSGQESLFGEAS